MTDDIRVPFSAVLPSLLYEVDEQHPNYVRFKEARLIRSRKEYLLQLSTMDFRKLSRCVLYPTIISISA